MPAALKGMVFVAAIALAAVPAWAAGMPEFGTKNFDPGAATPAYFSNENGIGDAETVDDGADDATMRSVERVAAPRYEEGAVRHHHDQVVGGRTGGHSAIYARAKGQGGWSGAGRSARGGRSNHGGIAGARTRATDLGSAGKSRMRHASAKQGAHRG
jgi:hypothetical protein